MAKPQRVRDPVHNLIEFDGGEFEQTCWRVLNTKPMQRLRRIKQLGFSEFVYPGACHTRLAHSIGVFHTSRKLSGLVHRQIGSDRFNPDEARLAMAAALVHDIGHGPFSHAFEDALKKVGISKRHELRTTQILDHPEIIDAFEDFPEFPKRIGELVEAQYPKDIYAAIVSSQFDADRLDYMRRDRMMSGSQQSGIDFDWLMANLRVRKVPIAVDGKIIGKVDSLVIDEKSIIAAEGYIFSLLYLYINIYFHKTTRGIEKLFSSLIEVLAKEIRAGNESITGLPADHPLVSFFQDPDSIDNFLRLDDTVVLGSLAQLVSSKNLAISELASRIHDRKVYRCCDVTKHMAAAFGLPQEGQAGPDEAGGRVAEVARRVARVGELVRERGLLELGRDGLPGILEDRAPRSPYKRVQDSARPLSRILVIGADEKLHDLADMSPAVNALGDYVAYRLYARTDSDFRAIEQLIRDASV